MKTIIFMLISTLATISFASEKSPTLMVICHGASSADDDQIYQGDHADLTDGKIVLSAITDGGDLKQIAVVSGKCSIEAMTSYGLQ